jgi:predicted SprT family Zn-dependent metalloprotease
MRQQQEIVRAKCKEVFAKAKELYPHLNFDDVDIRFDLKGRAAGMACARGHSLATRTYYIRFNTDMLMREAADHVINATVPHEIAHTVCQMDPSLGRKHDFGWQRVCLVLGGTGEQFHQVEVVYAHGNTYEYTSTTGHKQRLSEQRHRKIQGDKTNWMRYKHGGGQVDHTCAFTIVGASGHTFKTAVTPKLTQVYPPNGDIREVKFVPTAQPNSTTLAKGTNTGKDQIRPGFGKEAVIDMPSPRPPLPKLTGFVGTLVAGPQPGEPKAATSRRIMLAGYQQGLSYETVIAQMMAACGYNRQLARGTYKANAPKIGIPVQ